MTAYGTVTEKYTQNFKTSACFDFLRVIFREKTSIKYVQRKNNIKIIVVAEH